MKRILFFLLLVVQLFVIILLTFQFERIDQTGQTIKLQTTKPEYPMYDMIFDDSIYVEYEINKISTEKWNKSESVDYNNRVHVLLKSDDNGIYHVDSVSTEELTARGVDEVVLVGTYHYTDEELNYHYINYGMEEIKHVEQFGQFRGKDQLIITALIGKWGQHKITAVEKVDEK